MARSIFARKRDLLYTVFFAIHIPIMFGEFGSRHPKAPNTSNLDVNMLTKLLYSCRSLSPLSASHRASMDDRTPAMVHPHISRPIVHQSSVSVAEPYNVILVPHLIKQRSWFVTYMWLELLYHVPLSVWAIGALIRGKYTTRQARFT